MLAYSSVRLNWNTWMEFRQTMDEWEILLFVCIVGMVLLATIAFLFEKIGDLWLAVADLQDDQRGVVHDLMVLKTEVDAMAAREAERLKKEERIS